MGPHHHGQAVMTVTRTSWSAGCDAIGIEPLAAMAAHERADAGGLLRVVAVGRVSEGSAQT
jgi:hypothetical protein